MVPHLLRQHGRLHMPVTCLHLAPEAQPQGRTLPPPGAGLRTQAGGLSRAAWAKFRYFGYSVFAHRLGRIQLIFIRPTDKVKKGHRLAKAIHEIMATNFLYLPRVITD